MAVAQMVTPDNKVADVGTDHGYIPIYLIEQKIIPSALALDVNIGPLKRAEQNIISHDATKLIETRLSDGVAALRSGEADTVVIAGMGGNLIMKILTEGQSILTKVKELILQPQSEVDQVRKFLQNNQYTISAEEMIYEDGKFYPIMKVIHGEMRQLQPMELIYGPCLLADKNTILKQFLAKEIVTLSEIAKRLEQPKSIKTAERKREVEQEMCQNRLAQREYE